VKPRDAATLAPVPDAPRFADEAIAQARGRAAARGTSLVAALEEATKVVSV